MWQIPAICFKIQHKWVKSVFRGNLGRGHKPSLSTAFLRKGGVEGVGILGGLHSKQTNQKKKGEWTNG
jgi:hypothetical protein